MKRFVLLTFLLFSVINHTIAQDTITTASGLIYIRLVEGTGNTIQNGQQVKIIYSARLPSGRIFDTNKGKAPYRFTVGDHTVIPGWEEAVQLMKVGEKAILLIPAQLAYGSKGVEDPNKEGHYIVPPNTPLKFEIEIVGAK
jgi:peptidylprolyl isomerase